MTKVLVPGVRPAGGAPSAATVVRQHQNSASVSATAQPGS